MAYRCIPMNLVFEPRGARGAANIELGIGAAPNLLEPAKIEAILVKSIQVFTAVQVADVFRCFYIVTVRNHQLQAPQNRNAVHGAPGGL